MTHPMLDWLNAQLDEDERVARAAKAEHRTPWRAGLTHVYDQNADSMFDAATWTGEESSAEHIAMHDPAAVLVDIASKRAIVALHSPRIPPWGDELKPDIWQVCGSCGTSDGWNDVNYPCHTIRALVSAFAGRPGFDPSWGPQ